MLLARAASKVPKGMLGALIRRVYPRVEPELARLGEYVPRGGTAVDVGGWFGPWTGRLTRYAGQVVTIEADPDLAAIISRAFPAVRVIAAAASDRAGEAELWTPEAGAFAGTASVRHRTGRARTVPAVTIDGLGLTDVRFIKIDIEGHEAEALHGAAETIARDRPLILLELEERHQPVRPLVGLLAGWGYEGYVLPGRDWVPLARFDLAGHQRTAAARVAQGFVRRALWPFPRYVNSVLFRPIPRN